MLIGLGAAPDADFMPGASRYTPLVGAVGEGEEPWQSVSSLFLPRNSPAHRFC